MPGNACRIRLFRVFGSGMLMFTGVFGGKKGFFKSIVFPYIPLGLKNSKSTAGDSVPVRVRPPAPRRCTLRTAQKNQSLSAVGFSSTVLRGASFSPRDPLCWARAGPPFPCQRTAFFAQPFPKGFRAIAREPFWYRRAASANRRFEHEALFAAAKARRGRGPVIWPVRDPDSGTVL